MVTAWEWQFRVAQIFPWAVGIPGLILCVAQLFLDVSRPQPVESSGFMDLPVDRSVPVSVVIRRATTIFAWILGLFSSIWLFGFVVSVALFIVLYLTLQAGEKL